MNTQVLINKFIEAATKQEKAILDGDYKTGNMQYDICTDIYNDLKQSNSSDELIPLLEHQNDNVKSKAAFFLLFHDSDKAIDALREVSNGENIIAFNAEMTLQEWFKGNLKEV